MSHTLIARAKSSIIYRDGGLHRFSPGFTTLYALTMRLMTAGERACRLNEQGLPRMTPRSVSGAVLSTLKCIGLLAVASALSLA